MIKRKVIFRTQTRRTHHDPFVESVGSEAALSWLALPVVISLHHGLAFLGENPWTKLGLLMFRLVPPLSRSFSILCQLQAPTVHEAWKVS
jgi:hypothetical protein